MKFSLLVLLTCFLVVSVGSFGQTGEDGIIKLNKPGEPVEEENPKDKKSNKEQSKTKKPVDTQGAASRKKKSSPVIGITHNKEFSLGAKFTSTGWSFFTDYTMVKTAKKKTVYQFEFKDFRHQKEKKQSNDFSLSPFGFDSPKSFVYGKQNNFYALHFGWGQKFLIGHKAEKAGVEVNFTYLVGPSLGLQKPYYLNVYEINSDGFLRIETIKYEDDPESFLDWGSIYGAGGFSKGLGEIKPVPGAFAKLGLNFDWAGKDDFVKSLEAGLGADLYMKRVPIMVLENNNPYFLYIYLGIQFGKKW